MSNLNTEAGRPGPRVLSRVARASVCALPLLLAAGCAAFPTLTSTARQPAAEVRDDGSLQPLIDGGPVSDAPGASRQPGSLTIPGAARPASTARQPATQAQIDALLPDEQVDATLAPQSIPQFVATVMGGVLNVPYTMTGDVAGRTEMISGGTGGTVSKRALFSLTQQALRQYGIDVFINGSTVTVGNAEGGGNAANITRGREAPGPGGRVVQFFPVQTIEVNVLESLLQDLFPNIGNARMTPDRASNSLIISGSPREVAQVVRVLRELDQPRFAGAEVLRVEPVFLSADALAAALDTVLTTEGYLISRQSAATRSITILPFPAANQLLIFAKEPELLARVRFWVDSLDRPAALGDKASTFVYQVRQTDAQSLGQLAIGQAPTLQQAQPPTGVPGAIADGANRQSQRAQAPTQGAAGQFLSGRLLTDPIGNRILFTGTATEFAQLRDLLIALDVPAPQVVIEVMIAEVTLTDETSIGVSLFGTEVRGDGTGVVTTEGLNPGGGALGFTFVGPDFRARLTANASNNRVNILQRPQLVTRSGGTARFQVGTDVPIITSQRATDTQTGNGGTDVLQSVQYRQTGTILEITPVVYGDRVDISISQELSSAGAPPNPAIASPTILNRSLTTQIAISDGWTGVLGGLISNNYSKVNTGVPFLKDIPIIGSAFQTNSVTGDRTELLLLITPYIIRNDDDMADFAERYSSDMNAAFRTGRGWSYTLTPFSFGSRISGVGFDLPRPDRASESPRLFGRDPADATAEDAIQPARAEPSVVDIIPEPAPETPPAAQD
jgi:general secretion pathway protein D